VDKKALILVVDDNAECRELLVSTLEVHGFRTISGTCGLEAVALAIEFQPSLVLTDLSMPDMTGWDIVRVVRAHWPALRVGIVSGDSSRLPAQHDRLDLILSKPVGLPELRAALHQLERRTGRGEAG
jgi:CheY-like chemotaxis protein